MKKLKCKELFLTDTSNIEIISLVKKPAIEVDFMKFDEVSEIKVIKFADMEKRIVTGPILIPDKLILRKDDKTGEYYNVFFSTETIEKIVLQYMRDHNQSNVNIEHNADVNDVYLYEMWIIEDPKNDKSNALGYDLPKGTAMASMKVDNDSVWNDMVKTGSVKGFSIEGQLAMKLSLETEATIEYVVSMIEAEFAITHNKRIISECLSESETLLKKIKDLLNSL